MGHSQSPKEQHVLWVTFGTWTWVVYIVDYYWANITWRTITKWSHAPPKTPSLSYKWINAWYNSSKRAGKQITGKHFGYRSGVHRNHVAMSSALQGAANVWQWKWRPITKLSPPSGQLRKQNVCCWNRQNDAASRTTCRPHIHCTWHGGSFAPWTSWLRLLSRTAI
jgi:hypothetical protein